MRTNARTARAAARKKRLRAAAAVDREDAAFYVEIALQFNISLKSEPVKMELPLPPLFRRAGETA